MNKISTSLTSLFLLLALSAQAQVFPVALNNGNKLFFNVIDKSAKQVEVVQPGSMVGASLLLPKGSLNIPGSVTYKGVSYQVVSIHEKAFEKAEGLTYVSIPSSVRKIGARAFSGCTKLEGIVFPSSETTIGDKAFEGCTSLNSLSFGSEWRAIDLAIFSDSKALTSVRIPARVSKLSHIKSLKALKRIDVDGNNPAFSSFDGVLYSHDGKTLYACPAARDRVLNIPGGTEQIMEGAFGGCTDLRYISLPSTLYSFSYLEFAQCSDLKELAILAEMPPITAKWNGAPVFSIRKPNKDLSVSVPSSSLKRYLSAVCDKGGTYENMDGKQKEQFTKDGFLRKKDIK